MRKLFWSKAALVCAAGALATAASLVAPDDASAQRTSRSAGAQAERKPEQRGRQAGPQLDRARGAREAPAIVQAAGLTCSITEAAFLGATAEGRNAYEVACREGLGYLVTSAPAAGGQPQVFDCLAAAASPANAQARSQACSLPGNAQPVRGLQGVASQAGLTCTVNNGRYLGDTTSTNSVRYEIGCAEGSGYVLDRPRASGARPTAIDCFRASAGGQFQCQYTTRAQSLARFTPAIAQARRECTISDARLVGLNSRTQNEVVEVGCQGRPGFFLETAGNGSFVDAYDCGRFGDVACQFTAAAQVTARNAEDYTRLLRAANFDCGVSNFRRIGAEQGTRREIVEVACSNRPDGAFALLADRAGQRSEVYDCLLAPKRNEACSLTQPSALYPKLGASITAARKFPCTVTDTRRMGTTPQAEDWYEAACSEGRNYIVDYRGAGQVRQALTCADGADVLGGCKLPRASAAAPARR